MDLAEDSLLATGVVDVQLAPHLFHHGNVVEDLKTVPVHWGIARSNVECQSGKRPNEIF